MMELHHRGKISPFAIHQLLCTNYLATFGTQAFQISKLFKDIFCELGAQIISIKTHKKKLFIYSHVSNLLCSRYSKDTE